MIERIINYLNSKYNWHLVILGIDLAKSVEFALAIMMIVVGMIFITSVTRVFFESLVDVIFKTGRASMILRNYITFPGTMIHEMSHAIGAFITGGKVIEVNLYKPSGTTLGYVRWAQRGNAFQKAVQQFITGTAPIYGALIVVKLLEVFAIPHLRFSGINWMSFWYIFVRYIELCALLHMVPSKTDLGHGWILTLPFVFLVIVLGHFTFSIAATLFN